jgi:hypothetical protein
MAKMKMLVEAILHCEECYGKGYQGWVSPDGEFDIESCECNPHNLILDGSEVVF